MALVVENGSGLADADSYVSATEALAYHARFGNAAWAAATDAAREVALRRATRFLDASYTWRGEIATTMQALGWPRNCAYDRFGRAIAYDAVPQAVKDAACELALLALAAGGELIGAANNSQSAKGKIKRVKADTVEVEYQTPQAMGSPAAASNALPDGAAELIDRILKGLYRPASALNVRLHKS